MNAEVLTQRVKKSSTIWILIVVVLIFIITEIEIFIFNTPEYTVVSPEYKMKVLEMVFWVFLTYIGKETGVKIFKKKDPIGSD